MNIKIIDNFIDNSFLEIIYNYLTSDQMNWKISKDHEFSNLKNKSFGYALKDSELKDSLNSDENFIQNLNEYFSIFDLKYELKQVYINCIKPGENFSFHQDGIGTTILLYINPMWKFWWGSGTEFELKNKKVLIKPKPGRIVVFDSAVSHRAKPPNIFMNDIGRLSLAFQYKQ